VELFSDCVSKNGVSLTMSLRLVLHLLNQVLSRLSRINVHHKSSTVSEFHVVFNSIKKAHMSAFLLPIKKASFFV